MMLKNAVPSPKPPERSRCEDNNAVIFFAPEAS